MDLFNDALHRLWQKLYKQGYLDRTINPTSTGGIEYLYSTKDIFKVCEVTMSKVFGGSLSDSQCKLLALLKSDGGEVEICNYGIGVLALLSKLTTKWNSVGVSSATISSVDSATEIINNAGFNPKALYLYTSYVFKTICVQQDCKYITLFAGTELELTIERDYFPFIYTDVCRETPKLTDTHFTTEEYLIVNDLDVQGALVGVERFLNFLNELPEDETHVVINKGRTVEERMTVDEVKARFDELIELSTKHSGHYMPEIPSFSDAVGKLKECYWFVAPLATSLSRIRYEMVKNA